MMYQEGSVIKPDDNQCMECLCEGRQLQCFPILCPQPLCRPEEVIVSDASCCPYCKDSSKYGVSL